ncbi:MAG: hypothetical protein CTY22_03280 [Methylomonas sp.]|nr:MAG: hypothetical protein CTY23_02965 [Methylomonas sp.]PPD26977.1 MAG: hypothetical protein CTY22_03280 [Methylomonas sp.]PPD38916.1 MAG: hypothetical protein CTY21_03275 [Methylomonas sp.]PPD42600.1 MAG: hypothetical protein CTY17_01145 [Methylomonas sp.]PPD54128.1 MAG: hypothetical protein CTY11_04110 [Methylomonas sp.]
MPWLKWLPWRFFLRRLARAHGFLDPIALLASLRRFTQPAEVTEPIELLRAGVVFHARGLINSRVIQHNLDWVWPYWVERQFDPRDDAFTPRAFSITHVNLTHRNWTAIGWHGCDELPIVDPRGLLTPFFDGWSLDAWCVTDDGRRLLPSRSRAVDQRLLMDAGLEVVTAIAESGMVLEQRASVQLKDGVPVCLLRLTLLSDTAGWLVLSLRPYNPEGVSLIHRIELAPARDAWLIEGERLVEWGVEAERHHVSDYRQGDVAIHLRDMEDQQAGECDVGMATAAALFRLEPEQTRSLAVRIPLAPPEAGLHGTAWAQSLEGACVLDIPDARYRFLYDAALRTLVLHCHDEVYPGPYTYKRFWFRDAAFILHALLCAGLGGRVERVLDSFPGRQTAGGYFHSQDGEWDSNGEALWILERFGALTGQPPKPEWWTAIVRGARWIARKRLADGEAPHAGLLPAGFSAEHLGPNDYYYWDDFWGIGGLRAAAALARRYGDDEAEQEFHNAADEFDSALERSLAQTSQRLGVPATPASPYRRLDAGAIGSIASGYPLQLWSARDARLLATVEFLLERCFIQGGFFQDMIHSGINAYLTLHVAQVLLRAGDARAFALMDTVAKLASPTGQWPEAIHPRTLGGCMGDGQHVWAAAEWVLMMRNGFVREEGDTLILASGIPPAWLTAGRPLRFGPAPTAFGPVSVTVEPEPGQAATVRWQADWRKPPTAIEVQLPGYAAQTRTAGDAAVRLTREIP